MGFFEDWKRETVSVASAELSLVTRAAAFLHRNPIIASIASSLFQAGLLYYVSYRVLEWYGEQGFFVFALVAVVLAIRGRR